MSVFSDNFSYQINTVHERQAITSFKCVFTKAFQYVHIPVIIAKIWKEAEENVPLSCWRTFLAQIYDFISDSDNWTLSCSFIHNHSWTCFFLPNKHIYLGEQISTYCLGWASLSKCVFIISVIPLSNIHLKKSRSCKAIHSAKLNCGI